MRQARLLALCAVLSCGTLAAYAQENVDPTGTWNWTVEINGQTMERSLTLEMTDDTLTGAVLGPPGVETPITDAAYEDGKLTFTLHREFNGQRFTLDYSGTVSEEKIVGETRGNFGGQEQRWDWQAVRTGE